MPMPMNDSREFTGMIGDCSPLLPRRRGRSIALAAVRGVIDRRMLVSYRIDPERLEPFLPAPFRPQLVDGWAVGSVCMIRLKGIRPRHFPAAVGITSENAAHRFAVRWNDAEGPREGVFIVRRDTSSRWNSWLGGRLFPGALNHARFDVAESDERFRLQMQSDDGEVRLGFECRRSGDWPAGSLFRSLAETSHFLERGAVGYSRVAGSQVIEAAELRSFNWDVEALAVEEARSSFFDDRRLFPAGSIELDSAILMRGIEHEWLAVPS